jgi:SAM-dependent methyltransferase
MAKAFSSLTIRRIRLPPELYRARRSARPGARCHGKHCFQVATTKEYPEKDFDLVAFFDCLHDRADPAGAAAHVRQSLKRDGSCMIVKPMADDKLEERSSAPAVSWLTRPKWGRMRAFFVACLIPLIIGIQVCTAAAAHEGWFVRICPAKTEANLIHLTFSGGRQGFNWSWTRSRTPDEIDLPRKFRSVARLYVRGSTVSNPSNLQPHVYACLGFRDHIVQRLEFNDHEDHRKNWNDTDDCAC